MSEQPVNNADPAEGQNAAPTDGNTPATPPAPETPTTLEEAIAALEKAQQTADKYKGLMRKEEQAKKELWGELSELKKGQMSEAERAIAEAEERGREAARAELAKELRQSKLTAAAAQAGVPAEVLGLLDVEKLFTDSGEVNTELLTTLSGNRRPTFEKSAKDLGIGAQSNSNAGQLTRKDLAGKSPAEIMKLRQEGRLDALMKGQL